MSDVKVEAETQTRNTQKPGAGHFQVVFFFTKSANSIRRRQRIAANSTRPQICPHNCCKHPHNRTNPRQNAQNASKTKTNIATKTPVTGMARIARSIPHTGGSSFWEGTPFCKGFKGKPQATDHHSLGGCPENKRASF